MNGSFKSTKRKHADPDLKAKKRKLDNFPKPQSLHKSTKSMATNSKTPFQKSSRSGAGKKISKEPEISDEGSSDSFKDAPEMQGSSDEEDNSRIEGDGSIDEEASEDEEIDENGLESTENNGSSNDTQDNEPKKSFADLGVIPELCDACKERGYKFPTPIQAEAIPVAIQGQDIIGLAETGSGKTAAFSIPMLQALMDKPQPLFGLVLAPTRELAYQISQEIEALGAFIGVKTAVIVGGMREVDQAIALSKKPHVVVATPGRLFYHLQETKGFSLRTLKYLVMDEADRLLDEDFKNELDKILKVLPREGRRTMLFSATMSSKVQQLQRASLSDPVKISISSTDHQTVKTLIQSWYLVQHAKKDLYLVYLLTLYTGQTTIIFARTVNEVQRIAYLLRALGFGAIPLHGQLAQSARLGSLAKFKARTRDILVATDVAARGLDIPSVDLVLNYDIPGDSKTYVHRVGRTARAGKAGKAISLVSQYDPEIWLRLERALGTQVPQEMVAREELDVFVERVGEAQREAIKKVNDEKSKIGQRRRGGMGRGARGGDDRDREER